MNMGLVLSVVLIAALWAVLQKPIFSAEGQVTNPKGFDLPNP
jgi:uncharacterized protein involved in exopolysaccharide biosynthesis